MVLATRGNGRQADEQGKVTKDLHEPFICLRAWRAGWPMTIPEWLLGKGETQDELASDIGICLVHIEMG